MTSISGEFSGRTLDDKIGDKLSAKWGQAAPGDIKEIGIQMTGSARNIGTLNLDNVLSKAGDSVKNGLDCLILYGQDGGIMAMWVRSGSQWTKVI